MSHPTTGPAAPSWAPRRPSPCSPRWWSRSWPRAPCRRRSTPSTRPSGASPRSPPRSSSGCTPSRCSSRSSCSAASPTTSAAGPCCSQGCSARWCRWSSSRRPTGVPELMVARVVQGIATGAALGAVGAGLLDLDRVRGTVANAVAPGRGHRLGALVSEPGRAVPARTHAPRLPRRDRRLRPPGAGRAPDARDRHAAERRAALAGPGGRPPALVAPRDLRRRSRALRGLGAGRLLRRPRPGDHPRQVSGSSSLALGGLGLFVLAGVAARRSTCSAGDPQA